MPTIKIEQTLMAWIQNRHGITHEPERISEELPLLGTDVGKCDSEEMEIEIFPDRPDLLSAETLAHAIRPFMHNKEAEPKLSVNEGSISMDVDASLANVRPIILGAIVRGVDTGDSEMEKELFIKGIMEHQEKLHFALGRGRSRASIGVHDLSALAPPFRVETVGREYSFVPLAMNHEMSIEEILNDHPKGEEYAHLLEGMENVPVIIDSNNSVLSFPPIINGDHTTVTQNTTDFFIDVTGWDERSCESCLQLICLQLAARGGAIESIDISSCAGESFASPNPEPMVHDVPRDLISDILGWDFSDEEMQYAINRMGGVFLGGQEMLQFAMPRWRFDVLHAIDIVEDLAIGHGYEDLGSAQPIISMAGKPRDDANLMRRIRESLQGLGLQQVQSLTLSNENDQFSNVRWAPEGEVTLISNPITIEHTLLRQSILPSLLRLIASNRHHELPQKIYESGYCVRDHRNTTRAAWLVADRDASFAKSRGFVQSLLRDLGAEDNTVSWEAAESGYGPWLDGRGGVISINGKKIGEFGEIDPAVSERFELSVPLHGAEFDLEMIAESIADPVL